MADDFTRPAPGGHFPRTHRSAVLAVGSDDPAERARAFELLVVAYWKPVYKHIRLRFRRSTEDAADLTQGFFTQAIEQRTLAGYEPARALFRTYLRVCLDRFVIKEQERGAREKRGGKAELRSLDFEAAERELDVGAGPETESVEARFEREWVRSLLGMTVDALREACQKSGKGLHFRVFERYVLDDDPPSYAGLGEELGIKVTDVTNHLAFTRREFRRLLLEKLRELTATEEEFRAEARAVLGVVP